MAAWWKVAAVIWGMLEILFFAGLIFGWASLVYVLKLEGFYAPSNITQAATVNTTSFHLPALVSNSTAGPGEQTPQYHGYIVEYANSTSASSLPVDDQAGSGKVGATPQDRRFNLIYTVASVVNGVTGFAYGWFLDKFGIRPLRSVGIVFFLTGALVVAFTEPVTADLLFLGMTLMSCAGYCILVANFQLARLLPRKRSTVISLYCGAYDSSAFMLILVKFAYEGGISRRASFLGLAVLFSMCIISSVSYLPSKHIPQPLPDDYQLPCLCQKAGSREHTEEHEKQLQPLPTDKPPSPLWSDKPDTQSFRTAVFSALYIWDLVWLICHRFRSWSYVGMLNPMLTRLADNDVTVVGSYTSVYASMQFCGILLAPLSGRLMDRKKKTPPGCEQIGIQPAFTF